jgi:adenosylmethionine-8-amino-7-oxononanoate aminotransferase
MATEIQAQHTKPLKLTERQIELLDHTFLDYRSTEEFLDYPVVIERADGLYYWDTSGKPYFDAIGGIFVAVLGHRHPRVMQAMREQMEKATFVPPLHTISNVLLDFVEKVGSISPETLKYVKPYSGGSEATESALKFVRQYFKQTGKPNKFKFVSRYFGYHGGTFGGMGASGNGSRKSKFEPQMDGFLKVFPPSYYRDRFPTWEEANRFAAKAVEDVILLEDPDTVAAFIVEPIGNTGGIITPTDEYFQMIRQICDRYDVLLIFDEIITGFGKTGNMFAAQTFGVTPDIICAGKGISSGAVPLGAMIAREDMAEAFRGRPEEQRFFAHGHTFAGNPLACAAGIAVIDEIEEKGLCAKAQRLGEYLRKRLGRLTKFGVVREIRGKGVLLGVELVKDTKTMEPFPELGKELKRAALDQGLILRVDPSWFAVAPPLIAEEKDLDEMCDRIELSLAAALERVSVHR